MPNAYSRNIVYLSKEQYQTLIANGTITVDGTTVTYNENDIYVTPQANPVEDVKINNTSIANNGVANIPIASTSNLGVVGVNNSNGINITSSNNLRIVPASAAEIKGQTAEYKAITPIRQDAAVFYGLAKAAGDTTQSQSDNAVGTYTDEAISAIKSMLDIPESIGLVQDVQIDEFTILDASGIANIPLAGSGVKGVVAIDSDYGINITSGGDLRIASAAADEIQAGSDSYKPIVPSQQHAATFYGLASAAGDHTQELSDPEVYPVGTYTADAKAAIKSMIGVAVDDVQINGASILSSGIANIPAATSSSLGVVRPGNGLFISSGALHINTAPDIIVKTGTSVYAPITPSNQHSAAFYGLAKAAGDSTQSSSSNAVGTYTDSAKDAIQTMLGVNTLIATHDSATATSAHAIGDLFTMDGKLYKATAAIAIGDTIAVGTNCALTDVSSEMIKDVQVNGTSIIQNSVANIPKGSQSTLGVVKQAGTGYSISIESDGSLKVVGADTATIKGANSNSSRPIMPSTIHVASFYGLAKAAGDTTQSASSNTVGTYTQSAKNAIHQMLGTADLIEVGFVEEVSGTSPTITGQANYRYVCGEVTSISITPPSAGSIDVLFTSGSSVAVLTVPNTVKWPVWFDPTSLDTDTTYELLITDGVYGSVMTWAAT